MDDKLIGKISSETEFTIIAHEDPMPVRGNYMCSGDTVYDTEQEDKVLADLEWNQWAWCHVEVKGTWHGIQASAHLGCCSYESEKDFLEGGYCDDMKYEVIQELAAIAQAIIEAAKQ